MEERVVSLIKRKTDSGYDNFNVGPELRYVGSLPGSGNNNLEEQIILGGNRIIKSWTETEEGNEIKKEIIEYRTENTDNNYYILEIKDYGEVGHGGNIYVEDFRNILYISNFLIADNTTQTAVQEEYNPIIYFDNGTLHATPDILIKEYNLKYQKGNGPIDVSKKEVYQVYETINGNNVKVNKEIVTDLLL